MWSFLLIEFFTHKKVLTHPESILGHHQTSPARLEGECWDRQPEIGNIQMRKLLNVVTLYKPTKYRRQESLLRSSSENKFCLPTGYEPRPPIILGLEARLGNKLIRFNTTVLGDKIKYLLESSKTPKSQPLSILLCPLVVGTTHWLGIIPRPIILRPTT